MMNVAGHFRCSLFLAHSLRAFSFPGALLLCLRIQNTLISHCRIDRTEGSRREDC